MYELSIKKMREAAGFKKQPDAARALGWKERRYASIERGEVKLTAEDACVIAEVFGCTPNDLCGWPPGLNEGFADAALLLPAEHREEALEDPGDGTRPGRAVPKSGCSA